MPRFTFKNAFSLSSNSPRYLAPANIPPKSIAINLLFFNESGTSPETILFASPSTIAVLPVPGSPIRTVLGGVVTTITYIRGYGTTIIVDHGGGFYTVYSHVTNIQTVVDGQVRNGDIIAYMGDSGSINGSKLHFEIWGKGQKLDPEKWLIKK